MTMTLYITLSILMGFAARQYNRNPYIWIIASLLITPIVTLFALIVMKKQPLPGDELTLTSLKRRFLRRYDEYVHLSDFLREVKFKIDRNVPVTEKEFRDALDIIDAQEAEFRPKNIEL